MLLRLLGENPLDFPRTADKQAVFLEHGLNIFTFLLPILLLTIPILWFIKKDSVYKKKTKSIVIFLVLLIISLAIGIIIPELIKNMLMGYAVQSFYGGQI